jgi:hypothetical protein
MAKGTSVATGDHYVEFIEPAIITPSSSSTRGQKGRYRAHCIGAWISRGIFNGTLG